MWFIVVAGALLLAWFLDPGGVVSAATDFLVRGRKLLSSAPPGRDPEDVREEASAVVGRDVSLDAISVAIMVRSEKDLDIAATDQRAAILRAHVAWNDAEIHGWTLHRTVTMGGEGFSAQGGRRYSTARTPYENDLELAESVIASRAAGGFDPAQGATKFVNTRGGFEVPLAWFDEGYSVVRIDGNPESDLVFLRKG